MADGRAEAAISFVAGMRQIADGSSAIAHLGNDGTIGFYAIANADGGGSAQALAHSKAIDQIAFAVDFDVTVTHMVSGTTVFSFETRSAGPARVDLTNSGTITVAAIAHAVGGIAGTSSAPLSAVALAFGSDGFYQRAAGSEAAVLFHNSGSSTVSRLPTRPAQSTRAHRRRDLHNSERHQRLQQPHGNVHGQRAYVDGHSNARGGHRSR